MKYIFNMSITKSEVKLFTQIYWFYSQSEQNVICCIGIYIALNNNQKGSQASMFGLIDKLQFKEGRSLAMFADKTIDKLPSRNRVGDQARIYRHDMLLQAAQNKTNAVPIKQYQNEFLRQNRKDQQAGYIKDIEPFYSGHAHKSRNPISYFKKYKGRNNKFNKSANKQNGDFIIHNYLFEKDKCMNTINQQKNNNPRTIFGTITQNFQQSSNKNPSQQRCLFQKRWTTFNKQINFLAKDQAKENICQEQKSLIPQHRKKCKTFADVLNDVLNGQNKQFDKRQRKFERTTVGAFQKYSKIIRANPEQGKLQRMRRDLAKLLKFQSLQANQTQTQQITRSSKQIINNKHRQGSIHSKIQTSKMEKSVGDNKQNPACRHSSKFSQRRVEQNFITSKVGLFTSTRKFRKLGKYSHQTSPTKKDTTEQTKHDYDDKFQINGWDIMF